MPTEEEIAAARAQADAAQAAALKAAEDATAAARAAQAEAAAQKTALEQRLAALESKSTVAPAPSPEADAMRAFLAREKNAARLATVKQMGYEAPLSDAQILAIVPDVDPREPAGLAEFEKFRQANSKAFKSPGQTAQSMIEALKGPLEEMGKKTALFSADKLMASVFGGKG